MDYSKPKCVKTVYGGGKKQSEENIIKSVRNLFKLKNEKEVIKDRITIIYFYGTLWNNNYIEYESSGNRNKNLSVKEYLDEIKSYLTDIMINLQKSDTFKIQLTTAIK